jgi:hypothetical protein
MPWDRLSIDAGAFQLGCVLPASTWERLERSAESRESANTLGAGAFRVRRPVCAEALTFGHSFWAGAFRVLSSLWDRAFNRAKPSTSTICLPFDRIRNVDVETPSVQGSREVLSWDSALASVQKHVGPNVIPKERGIW